MISWFSFIIMALATWRISYMMVEEDGPWFIFYKFRERLKTRSMIGTLFACTWCLSVWIGAILTLSAIINERVTILIALPFALSATAIFITERI